MPVTVTNEASPALARLFAGLKNRRPLLRMMGQAVKTLVRAHLVVRSQTKRNPFGAPSSGFWGQAAEAVGRTALATDDTSVTLALNHPGMARAFGDVDIRPRSGIYLTIPKIAEAYNRRAYRVKGLFFFKSKKGNAFLAEPTGGGSGVKSGLRIWYSLVPRVFQKQDRSILPSDAELQSAALRGADDYVEGLIAAKGGKP